jgi:hypothetical protein
MEASQSTPVFSSYPQPAGMPENSAKPAPEAVFLLTYRCLRINLPAPTPGYMPGVSFERK